jgi:hypothetical protein
MLTGHLDLQGFDHSIERALGRVTFLLHLCFEMADARRRSGVTSLGITLSEIEEELPTKMETRPS